MACRYCRYKEPMRFYHLNAENAQEVLETIGFGKEICKRTYEKDKRFGRVEYDHIAFGFENKSYGRWFFGRYVVFDEIECSWEYITEKEFNEEYEEL